mmetsp:Transcript_15666/g.29545  ORF Transcript_15666/g.29545 Transcript_15666/m.29545 type:complete len:331 (-) Transcript_15666:332-1324(-)
MSLTLWPLLLAGVSFGAVVKPDGCPQESWDTVCVGVATCAYLADAGVTCLGVAGLPSCAAVCASPCCITTTTTTQTVSLTSVTTVTHTETTTVSSTVSSRTHTSTETQTTQTHTFSSVTATETSTATATQSSVTSTATVTTTLPETQTTTTESKTSQTPPSTTEAIEPAAVVRLSVRAVVSEVESYLEYATDSRVNSAYKEVMMDITGLSRDWIALQMIREGDGNITVTYILSLPYVEGEDGTLTPVVTLGSVNAKLASVTAASFNVMLSQKIDQATGSGTYDQKVISFEQVSSGEEGSVSGASRPSATACMMVAIMCFILARDQLPLIR